MTMIGLVAWCDYVSDDSESPRQISITVHQFAVLDDGRRLLLSDDRGFSSMIQAQGGSAVPLDQWAFHSLRGLESSVWSTLLPDYDDGEAHPWEWLAERLAGHGILLTREQLKALPFDLEWSERLRARVPERGLVDDE